MPSKTTIYDLEHVTDYLGFEAFCNDVMSREGYKSIQPLGKWKDKGRDAIHVNRSGGVVTVFAYSVRADWESKLEEDLKKVATHEHECNRFVFATSAPVSPPQFDELRTRVRAVYGWEFDLFDIERIATLIDNHYRDLIGIHPGIFPISSRLSSIQSTRLFDPKRHAAYLLGAYELWVEQYTPLLAEHKELDTFVDLRDSDNTATKLPVAEVPDAAPVSILLGESGAGKTTSLWKIVVHTSKRLLEGSATRVPILISLRGWSKERKCRHLLQEQLELFDVPQTIVERELFSGSFLILADGINEVPQSLRGDCARDLTQLISSYPANRYVISCRGADFRSTLLPTKEVQPPIPDPNVYEICRLDRSQIVQYANTYCTKHALTLSAFLTKLRIEDDTVWEDRTAPLQLARIPLYLQLFLEVFRQTGQLPSTKAKLLTALVDHALAREEGRGHAGVDRFATERMLGHLAFESTAAGLRMQESHARELILQTIPLLRSSGLVGVDITFGELWSRVLSANFLKVVDRDSVEWLHQLLRDYFLGTEYARIWRAGDIKLISSLKHRLGGSMADIASTIALSVLGEQHGAPFLLQLINADDENARKAFEGQSTDVRRAVATALVRQTVAARDSESKVFKKTSRALPYVEVADSLADVVEVEVDEAMCVLLIEAIAELVLEHLPKVANGVERFPGWFSDSSLKETRYQTTKTAVKRSGDVLRRYLRSKNEIIAFHAAKGLWETDRSSAIAQLRKLGASSNRRVASMVKELVEDWGIN